VGELDTPALAAAACWRRRSHHARDRCRDRRGDFRCDRHRAAGQYDAPGTWCARGGTGAGVSFILLGVCCALAGLCYAELASMIPQAGSAYAYSYATLGEVVAWIIGWDLNSRVRGGERGPSRSRGEIISKSFVGYFGVHFPDWLTTGYRTALLSPDANIHGCSRPRRTSPDSDSRESAGLSDRRPDHLAAVVGRARERQDEQRPRRDQAARAGAVHRGRAVPHQLGELHAIHAERLARDSPGAAIVFFAYIGFDAISTAAEETKNPQRNLPIGILGGLAICTLIYVIVGAVLTGMVKYTDLGVADPLAKALEVAGFRTVGWIVALGAIISMSAVLLVFQYGQPRIFFAMARDGLLPPWAAKISANRRVPYITTIVTGVFVALWASIGDANETYNLTNIGTPVRVRARSVGVLVLRRTDPTRPRHSACPGRTWWPVLGAALRVRDAGTAAGNVDSLRGVAGNWAGAIRWVRLQAQQSAAELLVSPFRAASPRAAGRPRGRRPRCFLRMRGVPAADWRRGSCAAP